MIDGDARPANVGGLVVHTEAIIWPSVSSLTSWESTVRRVPLRRH